MNKTLEQLLAYLEYHGIRAYAESDDTIVAEQHYTVKGIPHRELIDLPADYSTIRHWLGY